jgi:hydrogenase maturation protease
METKPDIHLFTVSINEMTPMTIELTPKIEQAIPNAIEHILELTKKLHADFI